MKKIVVIPNPTKDKGLEVTKKLVGILADKTKVCMERIYENEGIDAYFLENDLYEGADAIIVLGGDGTILLSAEPASALNIPVMGINLGRIGFMAEVEVPKIEEAVDNLLSGNYKCEERMTMKVNLYKNDGRVLSYFALNDCVISKKDSEMIFIELYREKEKINAYMADGMIIATPTGSTGYSLSAGGPVADPVTELFIATPVCAHSLSSRSAILPPDKKVNIKITDTGAKMASLLLDGQQKENVEIGEKIEIEKSDKKMKIIKMSDKSFYDILTDKLS